MKTEHISVRRFCGDLPGALMAAARWIRNMGDTITVRDVITHLASGTDDALVVVHYWKEKGAK